MTTPTPTPCPGSDRYVNTADVDDDATATCPQCRQRVKAGVTDRVWYIERHDTPIPDDGRLWAVTVTIPAHIDEGDRDDLFDLIADTAHRWEPDDRDGWDIDVSTGLDTPCPYVVTGDEGTSHCALAESCADGGTHRGAVLSLRHQRDALAAEVAALRTVVHDLGACGHRYDGERARRIAGAWAGAYGWSPDTAEAVATAITTQETP